MFVGGLVGFLLDNTVPGNFYNCNGGVAFACYLNLSEPHSSTPFHVIYNGHVLEV